MSDTTTTNKSTEDGNQTSGDTSAAGDEFKAITSQEDLNKVIDERLRRERAKFADYKDIKAKAERLDTIEEANKTEIQKMADRAAAAEAERDASRVETLRFKVAAKFGISEEDAELFLSGRDEETLAKQAQRLADRKGETKKPNVVPREGTANPQPGDDPVRTLVRGLFNPGDE